MGQTLTNLEYQIRMATPEDAAVIAHHRAAMFRDMGSINDDEAAKLEAEVFPHLRQMLADCRYAGWLIGHSGKVVAGGGVLIRQELPRPGILEGGASAHIVNVYTEPAHRRRGLARKLMQAILDWCEAHRFVTVTLSASDEGRPLYESLGFQPTNTMSLSNSLSSGLFRWRNEE
jgi:GNAT superfamily N-acetyltransferase